MNTASVIAMNGTGYGTSNTGNETCSAAPTSARGTLSWENPSPNPSPARPASARRLTYARCFAAVAPTPIPVESNSSPPFSHGVGSSNSLTWTHRIGLPVSPSPATRRSAIPGIARMSRTITAMRGIVRVVQVDADLDDHRALRMDGSYNPAVRLGQPRRWRG